MSDTVAVGRKHSLRGIASILFSIPFYIIVRLIFTTDRLDKFYQQNFFIAFPAVYLVLPTITTGFAIVALKQTDRNRFLRILQQSYLYRL